MISVVILTCNRKKDLFEAIESVRRSRGPEREIIVVDNGSTDGTRQSLAAQKDIRVLRYEEGVDLARCRNAGIDAATGDIIAFTDDDCIVEADWLALIGEDLRDYDAVGGIAKPWGTISFPGWWDPELNWMVGLTGPGHHGPSAGEIYLPASLNLAYRAEVLKELKFKEGLEVRGGKNMTREDSDLWIRTRGQGFQTLFDTRLTVYHKVPQSRLTLAFCARRSFSDGFAAYHREDGGKVWREKVKFIVLEPLRIIDRKLRGCGGSRAHELFWIIREAGFAYAYLQNRLLKR